MLSPRGSYWIESTVVAMLTPYRAANCSTDPSVSTAVPTLPVAVSWHTVTHTVPLEPAVMCTTPRPPRAMAGFPAFPATQGSPHPAPRVVGFWVAARNLRGPDGALVPL